MKAVLKHACFEVFSVNDGIEALEIIDRQHIDLIVLDVMMPNEAGLLFDR